MNAKKYYSELKTMARAIDRLSRLEPVEITTDEVVELDQEPDIVDVQADEEWWSFWCVAYDIIQDVGHPRSMGDHEVMGVDVPNNERSIEAIIDGDYAILHARVYGDGDISVLAAFEDTSTDPVLYDEVFDGRLHIDYDPIELGEQITDTFIGFLTTLGLSSAEALDYWGTEIQNNTQRMWANKREKSRQAVSKNVNQAQRKLADE